MQGIRQTLIFLTIVVTQLIIVAQANNVTYLITELCSHTPNHNLCISTLNMDHRTSAAKYKVDIAKILLFNVKDIASKTENYILGLLWNRGIEEPMRQHLRSCMEIYHGKIKYLLYIIIHSMPRKDYDNNALDSMSMKDHYDIAVANMAHLLGFVKLCNHEFVTVVSPIADDTKAMDDLSKVTNDIIRYLHFFPPPN